MLEKTSKYIYCLSIKPVTEFNKEHVIPESFGTFDKIELS